MSKDNENTEVNVLDELNKGASMGKQFLTKRNHLLKQQICFV